MTRSVLILAVVVSGLAAAAPLPVVTYDIQETPRSGFGCWGNSYTGTITDTGRTVSDSAICTPDGNQIVNYSGGSGTLNDGVISSSVDAIQLLTNRLADDGLPIVPVITLHLAAPSLVSNVNVFGGGVEFNIIPGALNSATVEIGGQSAVVAITPTGSPNAMGIYPNGTFDLTNTPLAGLATTTVVLRDFTAAFFGFQIDQVSVTEMTVEGTEAALEVAIEVARNDRFRIVPGSSQIVPVTILSTATFDAFTSVATNTLTFGKLGTEATRDFCLTNSVDVNKDGRGDLQCFFRIATAGFQVGDTQGTLQGATTSGLAIRGTGFICTSSGCP